MKHPTPTLGHDSYGHLNTKGSHWAETIFLYKCEITYHKKTKAEALTQFQRDRSYKPEHFY